MKKRSEEEWNDGILEYWAKQNILGFSYIVPSFHFSIIPELSFVILTL